MQQLAKLEAKKFEPTLKGEGLNIGEGLVVLRSVSKGDRRSWIVGGP